MEGKDLISYRVICPDGTSYASNAEGSCDSLGLMWTQERIPGYWLRRNGPSGSCESRMQGVGPGQDPAVMATCEEPSTSAETDAAAE